MNYGRILRQDGKYEYVCRFMTRRVCWKLLLTSSNHQLGRWKHTSQLKDEDALLADPKLASYSPEIDEILSPHKDVLQQLLDWDQLTDVAAPAIVTLPAAQFVIKNKQAKTESERRGMVHYTGGLSLLEQSQIANWIYRSIENATSTVHRWMEGVPFAHAITLVLVHRMQQEVAEDPVYPSLPTEQWIFRLQKAWNAQITTAEKTSDGLFKIDVDRECIGLFERRLFERSAAAGIAGSYQWGLDTGCHQQKWDPYDGLPSEYGVGDREEEEDDEKWDLV